MKKPDLLWKVIEGEVVYFPQDTEAGRDFASFFAGDARSGFRFGNTVFRLGLDPDTYWGPPGERCGWAAKWLDLVVAPFDATWSERVDETWPERAARWRKIMQELRECA